MHLTFLFSAVRVLGLKPLKNGRRRGVAVLFFVLLGFSSVVSQSGAPITREIPTKNPQDIPEKTARTLAQQKIDSQLLKAARLNQIPGYWQTNNQQSRKYDCLPTGVQLNNVVAYDFASKANVTLEKTLINLGAKCRNRKLVDRKHREIRFFRPSCWGRPPLNYLEIEQKEDEELRKLKRKYTVVVFGCNPTLAANPHVSKPVVERTSPAQEQMKPVIQVGQS